MQPPALPSVAAIQKRLEKIFPEGTEHRLYCIREAAARTIFCMLYIGAIDGAERYLAPKQVYRMSDFQAGRQSEAERQQYAERSMGQGFNPRGKRWYADNSREAIRDETLKEGLIANGAVVVRPGVPTTSGLGRYALEREFAALFDLSLKDHTLSSRITEWQQRHLSKAALARVRIMQRGRVAIGGKVTVHLPSGESRTLEAGPSSILTKAVIEEFALRFLEKPGVLWMSESGNKVVARDDELAAAIGLKIDQSKLLPDLLLCDLAPEPPLLVFVEVVATDGPITTTRREALLDLAIEAGFGESHTMFVTAFEDRTAAALRRHIGNLAWGSFVWCASEPDYIIAFDIPASAKPLSKFLKLT